MDGGDKPECEISYDTWLAIGNTLDCNIDKCCTLMEECETLLCELRNTYETIRKLNYPEKQADLASLQSKIANITKKMM